MSYCTGFQPIIPLNPKVLILGTMPSVVSLHEDFYYAHPRNAFWQILSEMFECSLTSTAEKTLLCQQKGIFLWDVLQGCQREGSLDSAIQQPIANDFETVFNQFPALKTVAFNGKAAEKLFQKEVIKHQCLPQELQFVCLPSTSPAYAAMSFETKRLLWQEKLSHLL